MAHPSPSGGPPVQGEALLQSLGYRQELKRGINTLGNVALVLSDITPTASLLIIGTIVIATAGTGSVLAYVIACFLAINVALCMGELGSMFPVAGGLFSIVTRVLGKPIGFLAMLDYMGQAVFLPASVAIGIGFYIAVFWSSVPSNVIAAIVMVVVTAVALFAIRFNAVLTGFFLALELLVCAALAISGLVHIQQPLSVVTNPVMISGGKLVPAGLSLVIAAIAVAMFSVNGYDSAINFSEETAGEAKHIGRAVVVAASIGIAFELGTFLLVFFGVPNITAFLGSSTPLLDAAKDSFGSTFYNIVAIGAILAIFNASLAITLQFARIVWAAGRDRAWPGVISDWIGKVEPRRGAPWVATLIVGFLATVLCLQGSYIAVVTFTSVLLIVLYGLICISALVSRVRQRDLPRPWKMPLWPAPPVIGLVGVLIALSQQKLIDLVTIGVLFAAGLVYYFLFIQPRSDRYWNVQVNPELELRKLQHQEPAPAGVDPSQR
ncbi:MAG TPA: APC family permease [Candidatus Limnocylindrales bacterium]|nr:APC family permease [Candidatus Limnocylindrales bacterium]